MFFKLGMLLLVFTVAFEILHNGDGPNVQTTTIECFDVCSEAWDPPQQLAYYVITFEVYSINLGSYDSVYV